MSTHLHGVSPETDQAARPEHDSALAQRIRELGDWFHDMNLRGVWTAPGHFLGDFPNVKWKHIEPAIAKDLAGASVLDIGCNGGFYSIKMKQRGAGRVLGVDIDDRYLNQARFAAATLELDIEFEKCSVYDVDRLAGQFDYVIFMGLLYHLRFPLYALDKVVKKVGGRLLFQTMIRGSEQVREWDQDYHFWNKDIFSNPDFPQMYFIERSYANDQTNWWIPNRAAAGAMLRSTGLEIVAHPESETWICEPRKVTREGQYRCPEHGEMAPPPRASAQLRARSWELQCPACGAQMEPAATPESKPLQCTSFYALSKKDQEEMTLLFGRTYNVPVVVLRYFNIYGTRQALSNPYTGAAAIFASRLLNGNSPMIFEDGRQQRDFVSVHDVVQANLLAMERNEANGLALNIGSGAAVTIAGVARALAETMDTRIPAEITGKYRSGDIRHCFADISAARRLLGYAPEFSFSQGVCELVGWLREQTAVDRVQQAAQELDRYGLTA